MPEPNIRFHNMESTPALLAAIRKRAAKLERFYGHLLACDVTVDSPHGHHHQGRRYRVVVSLAVPGETLVASHAGESDPRHEDCYLAIHDAFDHSRRQLQDYARRRRLEVKRHSLPAAPTSLAADGDDQAAD